MDSAAIKLEMLERMASVHDAGTIRQISAMLKKKFPQVMEQDDDFKDEEVAMLERRFQDLVSGKVKGHTRKESMRLARASIKG